MTHTSRLAALSPVVLVRAALGVMLMASGCHRTVELPPENPKEAPDERAPVIPILTSPHDASHGMVIEGFETPQSVLYDERADLYWVSNAHGSTSADDNGFISQVSPQGTIITRALIDGANAEVTLHAPKGLALSGETLFVADITVVRGFDRTSGAPTKEIVINQASLLNDLAAAADGTLYASDSGSRVAEDGHLQPAGTDAIYRIDPDGKVAVLLKSPKLRKPHGLALVEDGLWVASHGSAALLKLDLEGKIVHEQELAADQLDGIVVDPSGDLFISSRDAGVVFRGSPPGSFITAVSDLQGPGDLGFDSRRRRLLIPLFKQGAVQIFPLPER